MNENIFPFSQKNIVLFTNGQVCYSSSSLINHAVEMCTSFLDQ